MDCTSTKCLAGWQWRFQSRHDRRSPEASVSLALFGDRAIVCSQVDEGNYNALHRSVDSAKRQYASQESAFVCRLNLCVDSLQCIQDRVAFNCSRSSISGDEKSRISRPSSDNRRFSSLAAGSVKRLISDCLSKYSAAISVLAMRFVISLVDLSSSLTFSNS